ncbi:MAG: hypothetical protein LBI67_03040 [Treponema sp.]|jgi:hypothetical protein|nr:hypothetical protein [Treponema sp.]
MDDNMYPGESSSPDVLQHLLEIETQAAALVDDAQAEADRRVKASENENRERYEEQYRGRVEILEAGYRERIDGVRAEYRVRIDEYWKNLDATELHFADFSCLAAKLLFGEK